jgi:hypothetical protein
MMQFRVRSALAMRIVGLDRLQFNEAVASGFYPCAPATRKGSARQFTDDDLVGLYILARLTEMDMLARRAGPLACEFMAEMHGHRDEERIVFIKSVSGYSTFLPGSLFDPDHVNKGKYYPGIGPIAFTITFHIGEIRKHIADAISAESNILGEDDAEIGGQ